MIQSAWALAQESVGLVGDEFQNFITASQEGMSDYNVIDRIREAQAALVLATQSTTSLIPPQGKDKAGVFLLNIRNRIMFRCADEDDAKNAAEFHWFEIGLQIHAWC